MLRKTLVYLALPFLSYGSYAQANNDYNDWVNKATVYFQAKQYKESADAYSKAFAAGGGKGSPIDRYNAACAWTLAGNKDSAFFNLNRIATRVSFSDYDQLTTDNDLVGLREDHRWKELCEIVKKNKEKEEANLNKPLVAALDTIFKNDQEGRMKIRDIQSKYGNDSKEMRELWQSISYNDSVDLIKVTAIIDKYGWVGPDVAGAKGSETIFLVIQHADIKVQDKYLPLMREAVKNNNAQPGSLALLEDRVAMRHGKKQIYGSQVLSDADGSFLSPLEDPDNVDKRRAEVGLQPLAEYLQYFNIKWDIESYKKQLPDLQKRLANMHF